MINSYEKFGNYVTVHKDGPDALNPRAKREARINWSCIGEQPLDVVLQFHRDLTAAIRVAENYNRKSEAPKNRNCKGCNRGINHKHPNAKFCSTSCKDDYWNDVNPRGYGLRDSEDDGEGPGWDAHKTY